MVITLALLPNLGTIFTTLVCDQRIHEKTAQTVLWEHILMTNDKNQSCSVGGQSNTLINFAPTTVHNGPNDRVKR